MNDPIVPILSLELASVRRKVCVALFEASKDINKILEDSINAYVTEENLKMIIENEVFHTTNRVIQEEVRRFYTEGDGRSVIAQAVKEALLKRQTYTPLDEV